MKKTLFFFWALLALAAVPDLFARDYIEGRVIADRMGRVAKLANRRILRDFGMAGGKG